MQPREVDFLRYLVDYLDKKTKDDTANITINIGGVGGSENTGSELDPDSVDSPIDADNADIFIPPLQAKIEMMKKVTGVEQKGQDSLIDQSGMTHVGAPGSQKTSGAAKMIAAMGDDEDASYMG